MFFETIYLWFERLFGISLADYLSGYECPTAETKGGFSPNNQFTMYGFIALAIALTVMLGYYYLLNHPRFNKWWSWVLMLLTVGLANLFIGAQMTLGDLNAGNIGECLIVSENGGITAANCWMFGLANFFVSSIFFIIFTFGLKWWSRNCKRTPF